MVRGDWNAKPSPGATCCGAGEGRDMAAWGRPAWCGGTGPARVWAGVPFHTAAPVGGKSRGLAEEPLLSCRPAGSPRAPACPHLAPGLIFLLFTPEKLVQAMAILAVGFAPQSPGAASRWCALRRAPQPLSDCSAFLPSGAFLFY